ncbi:hypothetical protein H5410_020864 [Solanum commersonii]|uniref:Uncharacterized protein n=1 Tax=Solanum commersonii TaxID=4109 RepID=A0A9J5ZCC7_SOLCO|nr:hypothetical protein H5410_020864 [Solanum commersonii]
MRSMRCDKRPIDKVVEMVNDPLKFMITDKTPPLIMAWWNDMHHFRRTKIFKHLGFLTDIINFELIPTLEELGGFIRLSKDLQSKTLIAPSVATKFWNKCTSYILIWSVLIMDGFPWNFYTQDME